MLQQLLNKIDAVELSDPDRSAAEENYRLLISKDMQEKVAAAPEAQNDYFILLALVALHVGQHRAREQDTVSARQYFAEALAAAQKVTIKDFAPEVLYREATIAYMDGDLTALREIETKLVGESNQAPVQRLLRGLETYGTVDYKRDYYSE